MWDYPPGADRQLVTLLRWREYTKDPEILRVLLWLDGFEIPVADVRAALVRRAEAVTEALDRAIRAHAQREGLNPDSQAARDDALDELARIAAAKRRPSLVPRSSKHRVEGQGQAKGPGSPARPVPSSRRPAAWSKTLNGSASTAATGWSAPPSSPPGSASPKTQLEHAYLRTRRYATRDVALTPRLDRPQTVGGILI